MGLVRRLFNITCEDGIPNFFTSFQMLATAVVLLLITIIVRGQSLGSNSKVFFGWAVITGLFFYMGFDDVTKLHERIGTWGSSLATGPSGEHYKKV